MFRHRHDRRQLPAAFRILADAIQHDRQTKIAYVINQAVGEAAIRSISKHV
jgi:hypothetical protein